MSVGQQIKKIRKKMNLTQAALANKCGWSGSFVNKKGRITDKGQIRISNYETNYRTPSISDILLIATALKISVKTLICESSKKNIAKSIDS